jgi:mono/diheme cytochrome c family protein
LSGAILVAVGGLGWYWALPESAKAVLASAAVLNVFMVLIFGLTAAVFALLYLGPYRNPGWMTPGFAAVLLLLGIAALSTGEFIRESVRKPYVIYNVVLGNQIYPEQVRPLRREGYLEGGLWTRAYVQALYGSAMQAEKIDESRLRHLPAEDQVRLGEVLFQYHCNDCHAAQAGYSAVAPLLRGHTRAMIRDLVEHLDEGHFFMPPWAGTPDEAELLTTYLASIAPPRPRGMVPEMALEDK